MATHDFTNIESTLTDFSRYLFAKCGCIPTTVANILGTARRWQPEIGLNPSEDQIQRYIADMSQRNLSYSHLANTCVALEHYARFLDRPIILGRPRKPRRMIKGTLSEEEVSSMIEAAKDLRDKTILVLLSFTGIRNQELCKLQIDDVDMGAKTICVRGTKTVRDRIIPIPEPMMPILTKYLDERNGSRSDLVFLTKRNKNPLEQQDLRKFVRTVASNAGLTKRVYPHLLRHSLATNLMHSGTGLFAIKQQLGHVNLTTTMRYLHADPSRLRKEFLLHAPNYRVPKF